MGDAEAAEGPHLGMRVCVCAGMIVGVSFFLKAFAVEI